MGLMKKIEIDGKEVAFRASAAIPRIYRVKFHRDIYKDLRALEKAVGDSSEQESNLDMFSLEVLPSIIELWGLNVQTDIQSKKNLAKVSG